MGKLTWAKSAYAVVVLCAATAVAVRAQTLSTLHSFDNSDGANPNASVIQATDGNLYGTTVYDGPNSGGTIFKISPSGKLTTLYSFCSDTDCTDGANSFAGLVQATNGGLYGTTLNGGSTGGGSVFKITEAGTFSTVYSFCSQSGCADGDGPQDRLVQASDGNFFGTTYEGGDGTRSGGTIFEITPSGTLTTLYSFCSQPGCTDGSGPIAGLTQAASGDFYGATLGGGPGGGADGTVFKITPSSTLTTLHAFGCTDGRYPSVPLVQAIDGNLYGTTSSCVSYSGGAIYKITPNGSVTTFYNFCSQTDCADGIDPSTLIQASDGNLYGTTSSGGAGGGCPEHDCGTVFKITLSGALTTVYNFCSQSNCTDGQAPLAGLAQDTNGKFYGTTYLGGTSTACSGGCGTVFSLSVGLGPFVETLPGGGRVGKPVIILGTNLTGATSVTFNGTAAAFRVVSKSAISTSVPAGATTGTVQVVTPSGTLSSNVPFRVAP